jgi:hypothetical protein
MIDANDRTFVRLIAKLAQPSELPTGSGDTETAYRTAVLKALVGLGTSDARKFLTVATDSAPPNEAPAAMLLRVHQTARQLLPALLRKFQSRLNAEVAETNYEKFIRNESNSDPFLENANLTRDSFAGRAKIEPEQSAKLDRWGNVRR